MNSSFKIVVSVILLSLVSMYMLAADSFSESLAAQTESELLEESGLTDSQPAVFPSILKSALIPGWGELSMRNNSGYIFLLSEILLWSGRFYFLEEVKLREEESYMYALQYGGLQPGQYDDDFLYLLTKYNSSSFEAGGYNEMILQRARSLFPDDPAAQNQYIQDNAILDEALFWSWETREDRRQYSIMRKNADHNRDYAKAVIGVIVANHIVSVINSARIAAAQRREHRLQIGFDYDHKSLTPLLKAEYNF